jgi:hypothetical protein
MVVIMLECKLRIWLHKLPIMCHTICEGYTDKATQFVVGTVTVHGKDRKYRWPEWKLELRGLGAYLQQPQRPQALVKYAQVQVVFPGC